MTEPDPDRTTSGEARSAAFLDAVLDSAAQAIVTFDVRGHVVLWNPAAERLFGWSAAEAVGRFAPHVPPEARAVFTDRLRRLAGGEQLISHRNARLRKDGSAVELSISSSPLRGSDGAVSGVVSVITDVTELVVLEQAHGEADRLFRTAFENAPNGIMLSDPGGAFLDVNRAACAILRREREVLLTSGFVEITHPDDSAANLAIRARALAGELDSYQMEKRYLAPDGTTIWADLSVSVVRDHHGNAQFTIAQIVDIGSRKEAERLLAESTAQLETVSRVARKLLTADDARPLVCAAVAEVAGADIVALSERRADGSTEITAATLPELIGSVFTVDEQSGSTRAFLNGESVFVADTRTSELVTRKVADRLRARSALFEPVRGESGVVGGLSVVWRNPITEVGPRTLELVRLLATEAALGIERTSLLRRLEEQALTDDLTGLPNRRALEDEIEREVARARRGGTLTVAIIDLDWFKRFNDTHGHVEGDRLLRAAAVAWRSQIRGGDTLARIGGEEFVALLPDCDEEAARQILDRLRLSVPDGETCSIGFADWNGAESIDELLGRADSALYRAKHAGRNRIARAD